MRVLVTGHHGYIGCALVPLLKSAGHEVAGLDSYLYEGCTLGEEVPDVPAARADIRDIRTGDLDGFDAVVHLAAISNDPVGDLDPATTDDINHVGAVQLAACAREADVTRFLFSSSCSLYGAASPDEVLDETAAFNPVTPYGRSKVEAEQGIARLASDDFSPVFLRNATAYGATARLRGDLVVNNLVGFAFTTGEVLLKSDGTPWRPLVHVEDIALAFVALLDAPRELVHNEAFNVGRSEENYQIKDVAAIVEDIVEGSTIAFAEGAGPDLRCYRVDCSKLERTIPAFRPRWTVRDGVEQLYHAYRAHGLTYKEFSSSRFLRIEHVKELQARGAIDERLRWTRSEWARAAGK